MELEVLLSCMHQSDMSIAEHSQIQSDLLIINQCNKNNYEEKNNGIYCSRMISTTERGLSRSRNMALKNAVGDICLICDDDELLDKEYREKILKAFEEHPQADILAFIVSVSNTDYDTKKYKDHVIKLNYFSSLKISSWQIAFRRKSVINKSILFDESVGSGVSKAGGEENIFLHDCLKNGLQALYVPVHIGYVSQEVSQWSHNLFTQAFFEDRGRFTKKLWGRHIFATAYAFFYTIKKYPKYKHKTTFTAALFSTLKGIFIEQ